MTHYLVPTTMFVMHGSNFPVVVSIKDSAVTCVF